MMQDLIPPSVVAKMLHCSNNTAIKRMMEMTPINQGTATRRQLYVTEEDVMLWLERRRIPDALPAERQRRKRKAPTPNISEYADEYGRPLIKKNGKLVPMAKPPKKKAL